MLYLRMITRFWKIRSLIVLIFYQMWIDALKPLLSDGWVAKVTDP